MPTSKTDGASGAPKGAGKSAPKSEVDEVTNMILEQMAEDHHRRIDDIIKEARKNMEDAASA